MEACRAMAFHLDLSAPAPSSSHATSGSSSASRSMTPVPLLDSPSADPALPPASSGEADYYNTGYPSAHAQPASLRGGPLESQSQATGGAGAQGALPARTASGRAKGPPLRSTTMDDAYYVGPGEPSAVTRGKAPAVAGIYGAIGTGQCLPLSPLGPARVCAAVKASAARAAWRISRVQRRVLPSSSDSADPRLGTLPPQGLVPKTLKKGLCADTGLFCSSAESTWSLRPRQPLVAIARRIRFSRTLAQHRRFESARCPEYALHSL